MRVPIIGADDCRPCEVCGEPYCDKCDEHYAECACLGPTEAADLEAAGLGTILGDGEGFEWEGADSLDDLRRALDE